MIPVADRDHVTSALSPPTLLTVGYQGRALDEMIAELVSAGVERLVDVRELPLRADLVSRRPRSATRCARPASSTST